MISPNNGSADGIFRDVEELITEIGDYIDKHNDNPKPFVWTAKASDILEKVKRARAVLDNRGSACRTTLAESGARPFYGHSGPKPQSKHE